ncbi:MAG: ATP synthase subunit I [Cyanobacteria bacterium P01_A01_bin.37]
MTITALSLENSGEIGMNINLIQLTLLVLAGLGLGSVYFGGLWLTVQQIPTMQQPLGMILLSFGLRLAIVLLGGYLLVSQRVEQAMIVSLLACTAGFLMARHLLISHVIDHS